MERLLPVARRPLLIATGTPSPGSVHGSFVARASRLRVCGASRPALLHSPIYRVSPGPRPLSHQRLAPAPYFFAQALDCGRGFSALQMMKQRGRNVGRAEALFEQALDELVLPFEFAAFERSASLLDHRVRARLFHFITGGHLGTVNPRIHVALDGANLKHFAPRGKRDRPPAAPLPASPADSVHVILSVIR